MTQIPLVAVKPTPKLTGRQMVALELLTAAGPSGLQPVELGAAMHDWAGRHPSSVSCDWCVSTGRELLGALRRKGLARFRRPSGQQSYWQAVDAPDRTPPGMTDRIPF